MTSDDDGTASGSSKGQTRDKTQNDCEYFMHHFTIMFSCNGSTAVSLTKIYNQV